LVVCCITLPSPVVSVVVEWSVTPDWPGRRARPRRLHRVALFDLILLLRDFSLRARDALVQIAPELLAILLTLLVLALEHARCDVAPAQAEGERRPTREGAEHQRVRRHDDVVRDLQLLEDHERRDRDHQDRHCGRNDLPEGRISHPLDERHQARCDRACRCSIGCLLRPSVVPFLGDTHRRGVCRIVGVDEGHVGRSMFLTRGDANLLKPQSGTSETAAGSWSRQALERALQQRSAETFAPPSLPSSRVSTMPFRPPGRLGRAAPLPLEVTHVLDEVPPHLVADQLVAEARRAAGVPVALYVVDIDGSQLVRLAGSEDFPAELEVPPALGPEVVPEGLPAYQERLRQRLPGCVTEPLWLRGRITGLLLCIGKPVEPLDDIAKQADVPQRKARIVFVLLKRHGLVREHRGGKWERLADRLTQVDLSADLTDYEERRARDQQRLQAIINFCQTAQCRTRYILEHFGEEVDPAWTCGNCDACDEMVRWESVRRARESSRDEVVVPLAS